MPSTPSAEPVPVASRTPAAVWSTAGCALVAKALAEFAYEELLVPVPAGNGWVVELPGPVTYRFRARRGGFGTWRVEPGSVTRTGPGAPAAPADDPVRLVLDARAVLGLDGPTAAVALPVPLAAGAVLLGAAAVLALPAGRTTPTPADPTETLPEPVQETSRALDPLR